MSTRTMLAAWLMAATGALPGLSVTAETCRGSSHLRSVYTADVRRREHAFQNGLRKPLRLFWIDPAGKRTPIGVIPPGGFIPQQTNVGHAFLLTDPAGKCRATVRIGDILSGSYIGTSRYRRAGMPGWNVYIDQALDPDAEPARAALIAIGSTLRATDAAVPPAALAKLRRTPMFLNKGAGFGGRFHRDPAWLVANGRTVELLNAVEIHDAASFAEDASYQPFAVFHELAHGYHAQLPASDQAAIEAAYHRARNAGLYQHVKRGDGTIGPAYAEYSPFEYFAELSEAWFGRNDFYPFSRAELAAYDPEGARLVERLWNAPIRSPSAP